MRYWMILSALALTACALPPVRDAARVHFFEVAARIEPVAEAQCRDERPNANCDFLIRIDPSHQTMPNAYQGLDRDGRPVLTVTRGLLKNIRTEDELAFVLAHEAAHHIRGHLELKHQHAAQGAAHLGAAVSRLGGSQAEIENAQALGAIVGGRSYSKAFELEADALGTVITHLAGYSPRLGLAFFEQVPDPGDQFLGSHPANPDRIRTVEYTISALGLE